MRFVGHVVVQFGLRTIITILLLLYRVLLVSRLIVVGELEGVLGYVVIPNSIDPKITATPVILTRKIHLDSDGFLRPIAPLRHLRQPPDRIRHRPINRILPWHELIEHRLGLHNG